MRLQFARLKIGAAPDFRRLQRLDKYARGVYTPKVNEVHRGGYFGGAPVFRLFGFFRIPRNLPQIKVDYIGEESSLI
jgi:hypothetical protein